MLSIWTSLLTKSRPVANSAPHSALSTTVQLQSSCDPPNALGFTFAADVIKRNRQLILVLRETVTSFTTSCLIEDERHDTLRDVLIRLCIDLRPLDGPIAVIHTDPAPGFKSLVDDKRLRHHRMSIELGRIKNPNKNPVAEKAIRELIDELLRQDPMGDAISPLTLSVATSCLNSRIRSRGLLAREMWYQRDQFTNNQIPFTDQQLILEQRLRTTNHPHSEHAKAPGKTTPLDTVVEIGDLVYLHADRNKTRSRDSYLVISVEGVWCNVRKFMGNQLRSTSSAIRSPLLPTLFLPCPAVQPLRMTVKTMTLFRHPLLHRTYPPSSQHLLLPHLWYPCLCLVHLRPKRCLKLRVWHLMPLWPLPTPPSRPAPASSTQCDFTGPRHPRTKTLLAQASSSQVP